MEKDEVYNTFRYFLTMRGEHNRMETSYISYIIILLMVIGLLEPILNKFFGKVDNIVIPETMVVMMLTFVLVWFEGDELIETATVIYGISIMCIGYFGYKNGSGRRDDLEIIEKAERYRDKEWVNTQSKLVTYKIVMSVCLVFHIILWFFNQKQLPMTGDIMGLVVYLNGSLAMYTFMYWGGWKDRNDDYEWCS